eukprot:Clim_evm78s149 gene=Clim_evmTU78s149
MMLKTSLSQRTQSPVPRRTLGDDSDLNPLDFSDFSYTQSDETEIAEIVVTHDPSLTNWMGSIHPCGSLYEKPVDIDKAREEHLTWRAELESRGCVVLTIRDILLYNCEEDVKARVQLEEFASKCIEYKLAEGDPANLSEDDRYYLSEEYKQFCVETMSNEQLADICLTYPTVELVKADQDTNVLARKYSFDPLVNLVFTRDQAITTRKGIVMASLNSKLRQKEVDLVEFCYRKMGFGVIGRVPRPGTLEGGDFYPCGKDLCMVGVGLRSNETAIRYLMDNDLLGTRRVAIVKDYFDYQQQRMHLDTICNIVGPRLMTILETTLGETSPLRRLVDEYTQGPNGKYVCTRHDIEYERYLIENGWTLIRLSDQNQRDYGCNGLNLGNNTFLSPDLPTAKKMARDNNYDGVIVPISFTNMVTMYGSLHCCSQVVSRRPQIIGNKGGQKLLALENTGEDYFDEHSARSIAEHYHGAVTHRFLIIAPNHFDIDQWSLEESSLDRTAKLKKVLISPSQRRELREKILKEIAGLHKILTVDLGAEVFLKSHTAFDETPRAVFVGDWFSTHHEGETGESTLVLYSMYSRGRRGERRKDLLDLLKGMYHKVVNLSPCERGTVEYSSDLETGADDGQDNAQFALERAALILDRSRKVAYGALSIRCNEKVANLWADTLRYDMCTFDWNTELVKEGRASFMHTEYVLFIGQEISIVCFEAIAEKDRNKVLESLEARGKPVLEINFKQCLQYCANAIEAKNKQEAAALIMSTRALSAFSEEQLMILEQAYGDRIHPCDMTTLEDYSGRSVGGCLASLY